MQVRKATCPPPTKEREQKKQELVTLTRGGPELGWAGLGQKPPVDYMSDADDCNNFFFTLFSLSLSLFLSVFVVDRGPASCGIIIIIQRDRQTSQVVGGGGRNLGKH